MGVVAYCCVATGQVGVPGTGPNAASSVYEASHTLTAPE